MLTREISHELMDLGILGSFFQSYMLAKPYRPYQTTIRVKRINKGSIITGAYTFSRTFSTIDMLNQHLLQDMQETLVQRGFPRDTTIKIKDNAIIISANLPE